MSVDLLVNGMFYSGWTQISVTRSVKEMAGEFSLQTSEKWSGGRNGPSSLLEWRIRPQDACKVLYFGVPVVTGHIDVYNPSYSADDHSVSIQGRSKTADLCDCSAKVANGEIKKAKIDQVARTAAKPYGVSVKTQAQISTPIKRASVHPGETVHEYVERYAREQAVLPTDNEDGDLVLMQVQNGAPVASLIEGVNILQASSTLRADNRFSDYDVIGQEQGSDQRFGDDVAGVVASVKDPAVKRYRYLQLANENETTRAAAKDRASWESAARAGESVSADVTVWGWFYAPGQLWRPGDKVMLVSPMLAVNRVLAIESVNFTIDDNAGTIANLKLVPVEALNPKAGGGAGAGEGTDTIYKETKNAQAPKVAAWPKAA